MRLALASVVLLLAADSARADVFVPADPPDARASDCAASAGDVYAAQGGGVIRASEGGAPMPEIPGDCPLVAVAADGTAIVGGSSIVIRRPGAGFGAPIALGGESQRNVDAVAVAPGGWAVATVQDEDSLVAVVIRPDGTSARTVLDRTDLLGQAHVGIDAGGRVTVAWWHYEPRSSALRVARFAAGAPAVAADLPAAADSSVAAVAVAPGGSSLIAWASEDGVRVIADGGAQQLLDTTSVDAQVLSASLADDGSALLAYLRGNDEVVTVERLGGAWQAPRVLWSSARPRYSGSGSSDDNQRVLTTLTPAGHAVTAWSTAVDGESKVFAALGQAGTWAPATRLSSITRPGHLSSLAPDAAGVPRVLYAEPGLGVRGATLAPARTDTAPPEVTARFPARLPRTRDGRVTITVPVRCSEACDARLSIPSPEASDIFDIEEFASAVRPAAAGATVRFRLRLRAEIAHELVRNPRARRLHLRLAVTDRAGNVVRRSGSVRVRVIEKPIRSLKVAPGHDFRMKTAAGNRLVAALVNDLIERAARGDASESSLRRRFARGSAEIRRAGHTEIRSSRVRRRIYDVLEVPLARAGEDADFVLN